MSNLPWGAENDPRAPYNESEDIYCPECNEIMSYEGNGEYICENCGEIINYKNDYE